MRKSVGQRRPRTLAKSLTLLLKAARTLRKMDNFPPVSSLSHNHILLNIEKVRIDMLRDTHLDGFARVICILVVR